MNMQILSEKVAIITGASRGIGKVIALALARLGVKVVLAARTPADLSAVQHLIRQEGGDAFSVATDIAEEAQIANLVSAGIDHYGRLDILINNAAFIKRTPLMQTSADDWDLTMKINARAPFLLCREAIPHLMKRGRSDIINITSVMAFKGYPLEGAYAASKHAVMGMSKTWARELEGTGVQMHVIHPGGVDTEMRADTDRVHLMKPEAIAETVIFMLTLDHGAAVDEVYVRRQASIPWT